MESNEFSGIRKYLGKTQSELAGLLCVSTKAIQSFEQGWRNISASAERQLLFLLYLKNNIARDTYPCWDTQNCPIEWRENCIAWEFKAGHLCWYINGTFCQLREALLTRRECGSDVWCAGSAKQVRNN
jgi:DNA-binding XRE family transcriptional regulator